MEAEVKVVRPAGILDSTKAGQFRSEINEMINKGAKLLLIDLGDVTFMDSSGLGALVIALKTVQSTGGKLYVCSINEQIKILFELTSMDQVFEVFASQDDFQQTVLSGQ
jgi:anti-anti-sigma factor